MNLMRRLINLFFSIAATGGRDYSPLLSTPLTFSAGSNNETVMCASITAADDQLVECEEHFTIAIYLVTHMGSCLGIGNNETAVSLTDSDCMNQLLML
jgi:hypothetical protein